jgi:hypothetical protein
MVTVADADTAPLCGLVALIITVVFEGKPTGAVYLPDWLIVPAPVLGDIDHVTALLVALETVAVNCDDLLRLTLAVFGEMLRVTRALRKGAFGGWSLMVAPERAPD